MAPTVADAAALDADAHARLTRAFRSVLGSISFDSILGGGALSRKHRSIDRFFDGRDATLSFERTRNEAVLRGDRPVRLLGFAGRLELDRAVVPLSIRAVIDLETGAFFELSIDPR